MRLMRLKAPQMKGLAVIVSVVLALLVFGLGSAVATTLITSAMIKNYTIKNVDIANGAVDSRVVANGSIATGDLSAAARGSFAQLWAVVNGDGTLARGRGAVSSGSLGVDGQYGVVFNRDVSSCAYSATLGDASASTGAEGVVTVAPRDDAPNAVFVQTFDVLTGTEADLPFHLIVFC